MLNRYAADNREQSTKHGRRRHSARVMSQRGQHMTEVVMVIAIVTSAVVGMRTYIQRTLQAQIKSYVDAFLIVEQAGALPQDCIADGITDPAECRPFYAECEKVGVDGVANPAQCTQVYGATMEDTDGFEQVRACEENGIPPEDCFADGTDRLLAESTDINTDGTQQKATTYSGGTGTAITIETDRAGSTFVVDGTARSVVTGLKAPEFVMRAQLPNGSSFGGVQANRFTTPMPEVSTPGGGGFDVDQLPTDDEEEAGDEE